MHINSVNYSVQAYLICIIHRHANTTLALEREYLHSVFFSTRWCEHQLQFTWLFDDNVSSLVLKQQQTTSVSIYTVFQ